MTAVIIGMLIALGLVILDAPRNPFTILLAVVAILLCLTVFL